MDAVLDWIAIAAVVIVIGFHVVLALHGPIDPGSLRLEMPTGAKGEVMLPVSK